jgi:hypothetical protein
VTNKMTPEEEAKWSGNSGQESRTNLSPLSKMTEAEENKYKPIEAQEREVGYAQKSYENIIKPIGDFVRHTFSGYKPEKSFRHAKVFGDDESLETRDSIFGKEKDPTKEKERNLFSRVKLFSSEKELAESIIKEDPNLATFRDKKDGVQYIANKKTGETLMLNPPGFGEYDAHSFGFQGAAFIGSGAAAEMTAAKIGSKLLPSLGGFGTTMTHALTQAGASASTQAVFEEFQEEEGGEFNKNEVAIAALLGFIPEAVIPAVRYWRSGKQDLEAFSDLDYKTAVDFVNRAYKAEEKVAAGGVSKIEIFPFQKVVNHEQMGRVSELAETDETFTTLATEFINQNRNASKSVLGYVNRLSNIKSTEVYRKTKDAVEKIVASKKGARKQATQTLYQTALADGGKVVNIDRIVDVLDINPTGNVQTKLRKKANYLKKLLTPEGIEELKSGKPFLVKELESLKPVTKPKGYINIRTGGYTPKTPFPEEIAIPPTVGKQKVRLPVNLEDLQLVKMELTDAIEKVGEGGLGSHEKNLYENLRSRIIKVMGEESDEFKKADFLFKKLSAPINELREGMWGKVVSGKDFDITDMSKVVFDKKYLEPANIKEFGKNIDLLRAYDSDLPIALAKARLLDKVSKIKNIDDDIEAVVNKPLRLLNTLNDPLVHKMMTPEQRGVKKFLIEQLTSAARRGKMVTKGDESFIEILYRPERKAAEVANRGIYKLSYGKMIRELFKDPEGGLLKQIKARSTKGAVATETLMKILDRFGTFVRTVSGKSRLNTMMLIEDED